MGTCLKAIVWRRFGSMNCLSVFGEGEVEIVGIVWAGGVGKLVYLPVSKVFFLFTLFIVSIMEAAESCK